MDLLPGVLHHCQETIKESRRAEGLTHSLTHSPQLGERVRQRKKKNSDASETRKNTKARRLGDVEETRSSGQEGHDERGEETLEHVRREGEREREGGGWGGNERGEMIGI